VVSLSDPAVCGRDDVQLNKLAGKKRILVFGDS
jgi:hypothetical protein